MGLQKRPSIPNAAAALSQVRVATRHRVGPEDRKREG